MIVRISTCCLVVHIFLLVLFGVTSGVTPICSFIAATDVGSVPGYSEWECNSSGYPVSTPCNPLWNGLECNGNLSSSDIVSIHVTGISGTLVSSIGSLSQLASLDLEMGWLTGTIPSSVGLLTTLQLLNLANNSFAGSIPLELWSVTSLTRLNLVDNALSGTVSENLGSLVMLESLELGLNQLRGQLPEIGSLGRLSALQLSVNHFTGTIPSSFAMLSSLQVLGCADNQLSGELPEVTALLQLKSFAVAANNITGTISSSFCSLAQLELLGLSQNLLTGQLPPCLLQSLSQLKLLGVNSNFLEGPLPPEFGNLTALRFVNLGVNELTGSINSGLGQWVSLQMFDVGQNLLSGSIPTSVAQLGALTVLYMFSNSLTGTIPSTIAACSMLQALDVAVNHISGSIPANIGDLQELAGFMAGFNEITGTIPSYMATIPNIQLLGLQSTGVVGTIPQEFCSSKGMLIDVDNTAIHCITGCLKVSEVFIAGIDPNCHDGSIMRHFFIIAACVLGVLLLASLASSALGASATLPKAAARANKACVVLFVSAGVALREAWDSVVARFTTAGATSASKDALPAPFAWLKESCVFIVSMSLLKLAMVVAFTFSINDWWSFGPGASAESRAAPVESCTNSMSSGCRAYCSDADNTEIITVRVHDDFVEYYGGSREEQYSYCVALFPGSCAYSYWLVFKLVPLCAHALQFILQCACLWLYRDFVPQQIQYDVVLAYMFPASKLLNPDGVRGATPMTLAEMIRRLNIHPAFSVFALLEVATAVYVWGELLYPPVYCGEVRPLSMYYYPMLMTVFDIGKMNVYVASRHILASQMLEGVLAFANGQVFITNMWTSVLLALILLQHCVWQVWAHAIAVLAATAEWFGVAGGKGCETDSALQWARGSSDSDSTISPVHDFTLSRGDGGCSDVNSTGIRLTDVGHAPKFTI